MLRGSLQLEEAKIPRMRAWKEVRDGSPQRSTGRSQDSRMRAWKEGAAWQPAALEEAWKEGAAWPAALEEANIPE